MYYSIQKGCLPSLVNTICVLLFLFFSVEGVFAFSQNWYAIPENLPTLEKFLTFLEVLVTSFIRLIVFFPIILYLGTTFPSLRAYDRGLKYLFLFGGGGVIPWSNIDEIVDMKWPRNFKAIVISMKGLGLYDHLILGISKMNALVLVGGLDPIIVLSTGLRDREKLLDEITRRISYYSA